MTRVGIDDGSTRDQEALGRRCDDVVGVGDDKGLVCQVVEVEVFQCFSQ